MGAISASEDIADNNVTAIETAGELIVQQADDEAAVQAAYDEANLADGAEIPTDVDDYDPTVISPREFFGLVEDVRGDVILDGTVMRESLEIFSVGEKFKIGLNGTEGAEGTFRVYYAGSNDFGLFKLNDTVLASGDIINGTGIVEMSIPIAGSFVNDRDVDLWIEYNTTKGHGVRGWWVKVIENSKSINASVSPLEFVEDGENKVTVDFHSPVSGILEITCDGPDRMGTVVRLDKVPLHENLYQNRTIINYLDVGNHAIRLLFFPDNETFNFMYLYSKSFDVTVKKWEPSIVQTATKITSSPVALVYNAANGKVTFTLMDANNNVISGENVSITFNGNTYNNLLTNSKGQVSLAVSSKLVPNTYNAVCNFEGDESYKASQKTVSVVVKKATPKLTAKAKSFKSTVKTKKYTITLKDNKNKVMKNTKVTIKVNKKTYSAKTNSKGVATFKITKLTKKGKYTATVTYKGSSYYNKLTKNVKITIK
jgi:hypothetical protein